MTTHFSCIGLQAEDDEATLKLIDPLLEAAKEDSPRYEPHRHFRWTDKSGASLAFHLRGARAVECITPFFDAGQAPTQWTIRTDAPYDDPDCAHCGGADCWIVDGKGEQLTRAAVQWLHYLPYRHWLLEPQEFPVQIVAFARDITFVNNSEEFREAVRHAWHGHGEEKEDPEAPPVELAENAFIPEGLFSPEPQAMLERATALFAGRVEKVERLKNTTTGVDFARARINTFPGVLDTLFDPNTSKGIPADGSLALVAGWLVGRPTVEAPEAPKSFWKKLFGR